MASGAEEVAPEVHRVEVPTYLIRPGTLITARSCLIDRMVPDCEIIALPEREMPGGEITSAAPTVCPHRLRHPVSGASCASRVAVAHSLQSRMGGLTDGPEKG